MTFNKNAKRPLALLLYTLESSGNIVAIVYLGQKARSNLYSALSSQTGNTSFIPLEQGEGDDAYGICKHKKIVQLVLFA
jgi:hypothetical protein